MPTVVAGNTVAVAVPKGSTLTMSGQGTHQTSPPGSNGQALKQLSNINTQAQVFGPFVADVTVNIMAQAGGPGVKYSFTSSNSVRDTNTADLVTISRNLTQADNGLVIPIANGVTLTIVAGTLVNFSAIGMPVTGATASIAFSGGATGNGAATTITRTRTANVAGFAILQDAASGQDAFAIAGT
jgi:hypothetical protein